ncbi:CASP7 [Mytilus coruscus]|uniref:CASP7 n=1 Tax=Mytilus coruscus TaxID=42192 RepID=A0A6J8CF25_MYTCO|nr:CASP7 [Mytilus coruscus]
METSESGSKNDESSPDSVKKKIIQLIDRFKQTTRLTPSQTDKAKSQQLLSVKNNLFNDIYDFNHPKRGVAIFIINSSFHEQSKRPFAGEDSKMMRELFELLDFDVVLLENKRSVDLWKCLQDINRKVEENCDCLACVISSHGAEVPITSSSDTSPQPRHHVLFTADGIIPTDRILQLFDDDHCPNLQGKPRMFFIQACRSVFNTENDTESEIDEGFTIDLVQEQVGDGRIPVKMVKKKRTFFRKGQKVQETLADTHGRSEEEEINLSNCKQIAPVDFCLIPCYEDYLVMFSSSSEKIAWSDCGKGGWLTFCLYEVFKHLLDTEYSVSLLHILTDVCGKMANEMETRTSSIPVYDKSKSAATIYHMLTKDIFLKPMVHQLVPLPGPVLESSV